MITDLELIISPTVGPDTVRCYRMKMGSQTIGILGDVHNKMLAICADRLTPVLARWESGRLLTEPYVVSTRLALAWGVGHVWIAQSAEAWITGSPLLSTKLGGVVAPLLLQRGGVA